MAEKKFTEKEINSMIAEIEEEQRVLEAEHLKQDPIDVDLDAYAEWLKDTDIKRKDIKEAIEERKKILLKEKRKRLEMEAIARLEYGIYAEKLRGEEETKVLKQIEETEFLENTEKMFLHLAGKWSAYNNEAARHIFSVLMTILMKKAGVKIKKTSGKQVKTRLHFFWLQSARSGKDLMLSFLCEIIDKMNSIYKKKHKKNLIEYRKLDGSDTVEAMLNRYKEIGAGAKAKIDASKKGLVKGIFERYDLLYSPECSFILVENRKYHKNNFGEMLLQALEGTPMKKELIKWNGSETITYPNFCFIGATRPVAEHQESIIESGLQQRALSLVRKLSTVERTKMVRIFVKFIVPNEEERQKNQKLMEHLAEKLVETYEKLNRSSMEIDKNEICRNTIVNKITEFLEKKIEYCEKNFPVKRHVEIGQTFAAGLENLILILAYKNAVVRRKEIVGLTDFIFAMKEVSRQIDNIMGWIESFVEESTKEIKRENKVLVHAKTILSTQGEVHYNELARKISEKAKLSEGYTTNMLYDLARQKQLKMHRKGFFCL